MGIVRLDPVETLGLEGWALTQGQRKRGHPTDAARDIRPGVAGHQQGHRLALCVVEGRGGQHRVGEVQWSDIQHAEIQQLRTGGTTLVRE